MRDIKPEATARLTEPSRLMREDVFPFLQDKGCREFLDFGSGRFCKDSLYLSSKGFDVWVKELPESIGLMDLQLLDECGIKGVFSELSPKQRFDAVLLNYVLNVIPYKPERELVLHQVSHCLKPGGYAVITVRPEGKVKHSCSHGMKYKDGYVMGSGKRKTFQKGFSREEILDNVRAHGMNAIEVRRENGLTVIAQKADDDILYGQTLVNPKNISGMADYLQVALNNKDLESIEELLDKIPHTPIMFHGDYGSAKRDNALFDDSRIDEIIKIIKTTQKSRDVYGLTIHSPTKAYIRKNNKSLQDIAEGITRVQRKTNVNVMLEHRSEDRFAVSSVDEILELGDVPITVDIAAMFVSCGYDQAALESILEKLNRFNAVELHLSDSLPGHQPIGAVIGKGAIDYERLELMPSRYRTIEVLSASRFEESIRRLEQDQLDAPTE